MTKTVENILDNKNKQIKRSNELLRKCYDRFLSKCLRCCDDELLELKKEIKDILND